MTGGGQPRLLTRKGCTGCLLRIVGALFLLILLLLGLGYALAPDYTEQLTPAGHPVNTITYLDLDERTKIYVSAWLPEDLAEGERIPALVETSRYGMQWEAGWFYRNVQTWLRGDDLNRMKVLPFLERDYAAVWVQSPGSGQSTGPRPCEYPPNEVAAMARAVEWIAGQPWSNGRVGAHGTSYSATTADLICAAGRPEVRAAMPFAPDFDIYSQLVKPGGIGSTAFISKWGRLVQAMDDNDMLWVLAEEADRPLTWYERLWFRSLTRGLKRPPGDLMEHFHQAIRDHGDNIPPDQLVAMLEYRDAGPDAGVSISPDDVAVYAHREEIESSGVNILTSVGWHDAGVAEGALCKFLTIDGPQQVVIHPAGHLLEEIADPFTGTRAVTEEETAANEGAFFTFFDSFLKGDAPPLERRVRYFTLGVNHWQESAVWPPEGLETRGFMFADGGSLIEEEAPAGTDRYPVDFSATTGESNRWMTQMGRSVSYPDRRDEDLKLLTYTSAPLESDLEVTGSPTAVIHLASTHEDGALHLYLEDVGPDGRVTYLTEGLLRLIHRETADPAAAPYVPLGEYRTFARADARPMVPGEVTEIRLTLFPISTVFRQGHRIRLAIAGHDAALIDRFPAAGDPVLTVHHGGGTRSQLVLPSRTADLPSLR